jgi:hypothetical protein
VARPERVELPTFWFADEYRFFQPLLTGISQTPRDFRMIVPTATVSPQTISLR